jgi:hypothetical protein
MSPGGVDLLREADKNDLVFLFGRDKNLRQHYLRARSLYIRWLKILSDVEIPINGSMKYKYSGVEILEQLSSLILNLDRDLRLLMTRKTQDELGLSHERICRLFALNVLAGEPVSPR